MAYKTKICGIYAIVHIPSKRKYIGQAQDVLGRWTYHVAV